MLGVAYVVFMVLFSVPVGSWRGARRRLWPDLALPDVRGGCPRGVCAALEAAAGEVVVPGARLELATPRCLTSSRGSALTTDNKAMSLVL